MRRFGVRFNEWLLPAMQSTYVTDKGRVVRWTVDSDARLCTYHGRSGETFEERYPEVAVPIS